MGGLGDEMARAGAGLNRRDFLRAGGLGFGALGLGLTESRAGSSAGDDRAVILLLLVGGPSQLETFDPKPDAPAEIRGPFGSIATAVPGVRIGEHLPRLARRMDRLTLIRSLHHDAAPIHETGLQLLQTGRLCPLGEEPPHVGSRAAKVLGARGGLPPFVALPGPIGTTGVAIPRGQSAGALGRAFDPFPLGDDPASPDFDPRAALDRARRILGESDGLAASSPPAARRNPFALADEPAPILDAYGPTAFGRNCLLARRLVEAGVRMIAVNMYATVFGRVSWDAHGSGPFSTFDDYRAEALPTFDRAFCALTDDLDRLGRLGSTLVVATGEFGRTPRVNASGGRDHWPACWSAVLAGGGHEGGRVIGASDPKAAEPIDRPVGPADLYALMARALGLDAGAAPGAAPA